MDEASDPRDFEPRVVVRVTRRRALADEWVLVLVAEGLHVGVRGGTDGFAVEVAESESARAERALASFERENRVVAPPPEPAPIDRYAVGHALVVSAALLASFAWTGPEGGASSARAAGDAAAIRAGAWWRTLTALTLHADAGHVLGNAVAGALFVSAVFRSFGPGIGFALVLASGGLGNAANAWLREAPHATIGASTAVFGALGVLVGERMLRRRASPSRQAAWLPLGAGLALLAMLGTEGERVDFGAHVLGLAAGIVLGLGAALVSPAAIASGGVQMIGGAGAAALLAAAWLLAIRSSS